MRLHKSLLCPITSTCEDFCDPVSRRDRPGLELKEKIRRRRSGRNPPRKACWSDSTNVKQGSLVVDIGGSSEREHKSLDAERLWLPEPVGEQMVDVHLGKVNSAVVVLISIHAVLSADF